MVMNGMKGRARTALILDGSKLDDQEARLAREAVQGELDKANINSSCYTLRDINIAPCTGCLKCWTKTPGDCVIDDEQGKIYGDMARSNIAVLITPVTFGGYSSEFKKGMDRLIPVLLPLFRKYDGETHHPSRYGKGWDLFGIGTMPEANEDKQNLFKDLVKRNSLNMHSQRQAICFVLKGTREEEINRHVIGELNKVIS